VTTGAKSQLWPGRHYSANVLVPKLRCNKLGSHLERPTFACWRESPFRNEHMCKRKNLVVVLEETEARNGFADEAHYQFNRPTSITKNVVEIHDTKLTCTADYDCDKSCGQRGRPTSTDSQLSDSNKNLVFGLTPSHTRRLIVCCDKT
jgi:hypothetical protein